ncbi:PREDICTED: UPF0598 protein CG30010-like [Priapulus caudatus]|uniref:UPF0598 protein CG30010-like n=1 Tax=Priapulus caudatus TaxID=37621 RepID=A0ABM1DZE5_PRICU|nr:PREDICTED: UPF0598 protein CG30010-like [Priapulus caudatus]
MISLKTVRKHYASELFSGRIFKRVIYVQGQSPDPKTREYFYYIDHQGQLFLDDTKIKNFTSCFKDKAFLSFFFKRLRLNTTERYREFPYLSLCGRERNFVHCDDRPIVYTQIVEKRSVDGATAHLLIYNNGGPTMSVEFEPQKLCMLPRSGRVYYPARGKVGDIGLVRSGLAIEFSQHFEFHGPGGDQAPPTHFNWKGRRYVLTNEVAPMVEDDS